LLVERKKLRIDDPVARYIPEFAAAGKEKITVRHLLTHQGGLIPDNGLGDYDDGPEKAWKRIFAMTPRSAPGEEFVYSDMGFIVLGEVVRRVSGKDVHRFSHENLFAPLGMAETGYLPPEELRRRAAPTERRAGHWMQGEVHDPRAFLLGGVAGHAGLFSTARDLAVYAQMLLNRGQYSGVRVLAESTVRQMTDPWRVPGGFRSLGWDVRTGYSGNRGASFSPRAFGHGGFTGTGLWIDPELDLFVIFLSNRVHPTGKGNVNRLIGRIGTVAGRSIRGQPRPTVLTGIDVLRREGFETLRGRHVGLITNQTGVDRQGTTTIALLRQAQGVRLTAIFSPEHGLEGKLDVARIPDGRDPLSGVPVFSLYGETRRPTDKMLQGIDTLVYDIQDVGARFYTYTSTMGYAMQEAARRRIRFVVLDRPNPIGGVEVDGPMLDAGRQSFVAFHRLPIRHGMTVGELAMMFRQELGLDLDLAVVRMEGWRRDTLFDATGLKWITPSPNMRSLTEALLYPGICPLETTNISVGRGTPTPFEVIGAPWLDGQRLQQALAAAGLPGVEFRAVKFVPTSSKFARQECNGIRITITDRAALRPIRTGLEIARQLWLQYPRDWTVALYEDLLGNRAVYEALRSSKSVAEMEALYRPELEQFLGRRERFLLYP
ncbi:MAG: exo-beta-N-acetylmuramidase NamZ domain-containing protein, partial [Thermoguttaceae bacterium]